MTYSWSSRSEGLLVFRTLADAVHNGFEVYDRTRDGYLVRTLTDGGWALAIVREAGDDQSGRVERVCN